MTDDRRPVYITREWLQYLAVSLYERVGGIEAPSNNELVVSDDDDAGLEETKSVLYRLANDIQQAPPTYEQQRIETLETQVSELLSLCAELQKQINDINQGVLPQG